MVCSTFVMLSLSLSLWVLNCIFGFAKWRSCSRQAYFFSSDIHICGLIGRLIQSKDSIDVLEIRRHELRFDHTKRLAATNLQAVRGDAGRSSLSVHHGDITRRVRFGDVPLSQKLFSFGLGPRSSQISGFAPSSLTI